jgi:tetratricopeptide (TPR) repeat protein
MHRNKNNIKKPPNITDKGEGGNGLDQIIDNTALELSTMDFGECTDKGSPAFAHNWYQEYKSNLTSKNYQAAYSMLCRENKKDDTDGFIWFRYGLQLEEQGYYERAQKAYICGAKYCNSFRTDNLRRAATMTLLEIKDVKTSLELLSKALLSVTDVNKGFGLKYRFNPEILNVGQEEAIQYYILFMELYSKGENFENSIQELKRIVLATELRSSGMLNHAQDIIIAGECESDCKIILRNYNNKITKKLVTLNLVEYQDTKGETDGILLSDYMNQRMEEMKKKNQGLF